MATALRVYQLGPVTYPVSVAVTGGMIVQPDPTNVGSVMPAAAGSATALGVAMTDAAPITAPNPANPLDISTVRNTTSVEFGPADVVCVFSAAALLGDRVVCTANGQVGPGGATPAVNTVIGICTEPKGVTAAGPGRVRFLL